MAFHLALAGVWGGLLALERRAFLQAMFSRPLVAAVGAGLLLEDASSGLFVGLAFELYYLGGASLGGAHPDHETLPAVAAASFAACLSAPTMSDGTPAMWSLGIILFAPFGPLGRVIETAFDARAARYLGEASKAADAGNFRRVARQNLWGMWPHFIAFGLLCSLAGLVGHLLARPFAAAPLPLLRGLAWAYPAMASVAAGLAARGSRSKKAQVFAGAGAAATLAALAFGGPL
jgi:PTS system mannose-specific IIC component